MQSMVKSTQGSGDEDLDYRMLTRVQACLRDWAAVMDIREHLAHRHGATVQLTEAGQHMESFYQLVCRRQRKAAAENKWRPWLSQSSNPPSRVCYPVNMPVKPDHDHDHELSQRKRVVTPRLGIRPWCFAHLRGNLSPPPQPPQICRHVCRAEGQVQSREYRP